MATENNYSISDSTQPNSGRIYDYFLGGHHYFEMDRQKAEQIEKLAPFVPKTARLVRAFLKEAIIRAIKMNFTQFLDFASGLPTEDHIHKNTPNGTKVIYSDIDTVIVEYGREIIGKNDHVKYEYCDAAKPETLLNSDIVKSMFGNNHKCVIGLSGICWFLKDEEISHTLKVLYDWADEGSILYLTISDRPDDTDNEEFKTIKQFYDQMKQPIYMRPKETLIEIAKPWIVKEPGFLLVEQWIGLGSKPVITGDVIETWGGGGLHGGFLEK